MNTLSGRSFLLAGLAALLLGSSLGCGYSLTSKGSNLPAHVKVIAIPEFANQTSRPELGQRVTEKLREQLVARGKYQVTSDTRNADAILRGSVRGWDAKPVQLSDDRSDAERVTVTLDASVTFEDRVVNRVTWQQDGYKFTGEYDTVGDPTQYFDTELGAVEEVAEDFARAVLSAILQGF
ncbi:MAG: LPS assembly lipoprotein LptE [Acidobacteriota bacterium]